MSVLSPIETAPIEYPSSDGEAMAESDITRFYMIYSVEVLEIYFQNRPNVYVSANSFVYYEPGNKDAVVAPDVYVVFGVNKRQRDNYKIWEENGISPNFILEITSKTTQDKDQKTKPEIYQKLGVVEYFQYDPSGDYLNPILQGLHLINGQYQTIPARGTAFDNFWVWSEVLGLELHIVYGELRFKDPETGEFLKTYGELDAALQQTEATLQQTEAALAEERQARTQVESVLRSLVEQLLTSGLEIEQVAQMTQLSPDEIRRLVGE
ncbi:MAG TPA: hypothetical protein DEG17_08465 [Cyanobacteria bacterium UBA11149]|nr:hypothetical protein [Cyanobacteria bacterium UBA11367]HBE59734.1 hypothetical protein [Cyanobacteria bacterium UBA11366]HBK63595.1 hypothetical protein [Cyanobacteria bacterium UBA11166]HBR75138.1 hypothetical protein [Cyanobacteria bacterium UBA11159]HBS68183.1 hypothetical protein [Cyanobacteria bacterium UBA11153]HBW88892.1 hypothetical protein [Cyanobacteria bacterium UBA11149]HCA94575.1 hypothetical protein [Cyanobacteria bacterium UBA9226]